MTHDDLVDDAWLQPAAKRSRLRLLLLVLLAAAVVFLGGALTQRHLGSDASISAGAATGLPDAGSLPAGFPAGAVPAAGDAGTSTGATTGAGTDASTTADAGETVIGEVTAMTGRRWVVEDLGGKRHVVRIADDATLTAPYDGSGALQVGATVTVAGDPTDGGALTAHSITIR